MATILFWGPLFYFFYTLASPYQFCLKQEGATFFDEIGMYVDNEQMLKWDGLNEQEKNFLKNHREWCDWHTDW
jgi:hypothetical protein